MADTNEWFVDLLDWLERDREDAMSRMKAELEKDEPNRADFWNGYCQAHDTIWSYLEHGK